MKKAKLKFTIIDQKYNEKYGKYPDYDYIRMYHEKGADYANKTINERINSIWEEMQAEHKKELAYLNDCPFE